MCTATNYTAKDHYFGRNLDLEFSYHEAVTITPRNFPFPFRKAADLTTHYAMVGMTTVADGYPLYYDATNEKGLSMAGLNFPENADYKAEVAGMDNISPFEFIPWILGQFETVAQVREALEKLVLVDISFSAELPLSPLHWIISDREESLTVESVKDGLKVYDNPVGLLTNNPTFDIQLFNLNNYASVSTAQPENRFSKKLQLDTYSRGLGAVGLPGDLSSMSRFVKAVFTAENSLSGESESEAVSQFFHILGSVEQQRGCVEVGDRYEITIYSSCCNTDKGIYYYRTYENSQLTAVDLHKVDLDGDSLSTYPLVTGQQVREQN
ncbi:choloylglycine hydrolase [Nocardioides marmotae]|uniref:choloylglycine hydrolase n=1 Tax=Nocardioides marmotae TaxID=2663857 RepID=UPI00132A5B27|nr:choloylglycine hydrolase [Nocardioides marmotae]MBC9735208.1 choloylglycine hydrolase family protein [Nocardioides marmotae]MTB86308.1 linear amide C-N hydrolase [Nocardioides marmotae]